MLSNIGDLHYVIKYVINYNLAYDEICNLSSNT